MSEDKDLKKEEIEDTANVQDEQGNEKDSTSSPSWEDKYNELNDKYVRIHAEFDNFRRRTNKEKLDIISTAGEGVLRDLLPVLDDFERAIENNKKVDDLDSVKEGFNLIFHKFKTTMEAKGLKPMDSVGEVFDVEIHEAIANVPVEKKKQKGKVIEAVEKGYYLNDKVIRFAKVVVGQ